MTWELARRGLSPVLVSGEEPAASRVAAGMLAPMPEAGTQGRLARLAAESLRHYPAFLEALAEDTEVDPGFERTGILRLAYSPDEAAALRGEVGTYEAAGIPSRWLGASACLDEVRGLGAENLAGGLLTYDEAQVQPGWLLEALRSAAERRGARFQQGEVEGLDVGPGRTRVRLRGGETLDVDVAVVCLGSWSGLLPGLELPVEPVRGQLLVFEGVPRPARILYVGHDYILGKADGTLIVGGTVEPGAGFSTEPGPAVARLIELLPRVWPAAAGRKALTRVGLRPTSPDGLPIIGHPAGHDGVYVFTAHYRNGFLLAPLTASLAADEVLGEEREGLLAPFRPTRLR